MNIFQFTLLSLKGRKINTIFTVIAIVLAVTLTYSVMFMSSGLEDGIKKQAGSYDIVIGAEGSPTQLALNSIMYLDVPTGNIPYSLFEAMQKDERVLKAVPLALGDSYYGIPIVGTNLDYFQPFRKGLQERFSLSQGSWFAEPGEVVLGHNSAKHTKLSIGDTFVGNHGSEESGQVHEDFEYKVVGILSPTGSADDKGIFTPYESIWSVHVDDEHEEHSEEEGKEESEHEEHTEEENKEESEHDNEKEHDEEGLEITAILIKPEQLGYVPALYEELNAQHEVQAVFPVKVFRQLLETFNYGKQMAILLVGVSIVLAGLFIVFAILSSVAQRKSEISILRSLGVSRTKIIYTIILESTIIIGLSTLFGIVVAYGSYFIIKSISLYYVGISLGDIKYDPQYLIFASLLFSVAMLISLLPLLPLYLKKKE
ncbi:ABC transporter permease [Bacillus sp. DJP31]|uniref:ABC transporter permease n=1 Tax=Bacillus sp. DJP31 TaxID=3409789 RepID=UPI003BB687EC